MARNYTGEMLYNDFWRQAMERTVNIHIEKLPEGVYLATSDDLQGLVAQGRTVAETLEIARDVARKLIEARSNLNLAPVADQFDYPLILSVG
jgi:predicted RNase H-like HicB family nuclease